MRRYAVWPLEGVVDAEEAGRAYLYTFNRNHFAARAIASLSDIRSEFERRLRAEVTTLDIDGAVARSLDKVQGAVVDYTLNAHSLIHIIDARGGVLYGSPELSPEQPSRHRNVAD